MVEGQGKDQEGSVHDDLPQQLSLSLLQRLDRLDYLMQAFEERHCCSSRHSPSVRMVNGIEDGEGNHPHKTVTTVLEEVQSKGTLLERVTVLEDRLMQLNLEIKGSNASKSISSVAAVEKVPPESESLQSDVQVAVQMKNHEEKPRLLPTNGMGDGEESSMRKSRRRRHGRRWSIFNARKLSFCSSRWDDVHVSSTHP